jgi:hypothetical protein
MISPVLTESAQLRFKTSPPLAPVPWVLAVDAETVRGKVRAGSNENTVGKAKGGG